LLPPKSDPSA